MVTYKDLYDKVATYITNLNDQERIYKAYQLAEKLHNGQCRKSGELYITHPLSVAIILAELHVGPDTIIAGILHDVVEDCEISLEKIEDLFGHDVSHMVDGVTKLTKLTFTSLEEKQAENQQKMLLAMGKDIRVIVVKLADRLHNIRTINFQSPDKRERICKETLEIYAPLANRLGMYQIKAELEDRSLKYTDSEMYDKIENKINEKVLSKNNNIDKIIEDIKEYLKNEGIKGFSIKGRVKNIYSIYKKMINQHKEFEDIYDVLAVRIIVDSIDNCYRVLGLIHAHYTPVPKRFKDYIAVPKPNMYQSLHTTLLSQDGITFEVQIRTHEMDQVAELGIAAHWAYKENASYSKEKEQFEIASKLKWYAELLKFNEENNNVSSKDFVDSIKNDILTTSVYVYTPTGEVIDLPKGATPIDLAYKIHTEIGNQMIGAIVNQKIVPNDYELKNGDIVSIRTSKQATPSVDWLKIVKTAHAKHKIKNFLNKLNKDSLFESGKKNLEEELKLNSLSISVLKDDFVKESFGKNNINNLFDLCVEIGKGSISSKSVSLKLLNIYKKDDNDTILKKHIEKSNKILNKSVISGVVIDGIKNPKLKLATCCNPVKGDEIVGYVTKGNGIVCHNVKCNNLKNLDQNRLISCYFDLDSTYKYKSSLIIEAMYSEKLLSNIMSEIVSSQISLLQVNTKKHKDLSCTISVKVLVTSIVELEKLMANLMKVSGINDIRRDNL